MAREMKCLKRLPNDSSEHPSTDETTSVRNDTVVTEPAIVWEEGKWVTSGVILFLFMTFSCRTPLKNKSCKWSTSDLCLCAQSSFTAVRAVCVRLHHTKQWQLFIVFNR